MFVTLGLLVFGLAGSVRLVYHTTGGLRIFESLLLERVANLPMDVNVSLIWAGAQLVMEGLVSMTLLFSTALFIYGMEGVGFWGFGRARAPPCPSGRIVISNYM
jgi:hypothetical protein